MVLYFSGTGNSRYVAKMVADIIGDELISLNDAIKFGKTKTFHSDKPFVFISPTYAWRLPRVVTNFILKNNFSGNKEAYFILTCGMGTGNAVGYTKELCNEKSFNFMGFSSIIMPQNYIVMFSVPNENKSETIIKKSTPKIIKVAKMIKEGSRLPNEKVRTFEHIASGSMNTFFYKMFVKANGFRSLDSCTSCGKCVSVCPLNNIKLIDGKPQWGCDCTHCMACISRCPQKAIEYKNMSKGKRRYYLKEESM